MEEVAELPEVSGSIWEGLGEASGSFRMERKALQTSQASGQGLWATAAWQLRGESAAVLPHVKESIGDEAEHHI